MSRQIIWSQKELEETLSTKVNNAIIVTGKAEFNSKNVQPGDIFIALKGNGDGHDYVLDALAKGAACAIISKYVDNAPPDKVIYVPDTIFALQQMAEYKRKISKAKFIAITGSIGKTSVKEIVYCALKQHNKTFVSRGNFNNHLGLPLNLASMPNDLDYSIFELGMSASGELRNLTKLLKPDIGIITNIAPAHLENFDNMQGIVDAKCEIFEGLDENAIAIINFDSNYYQNVIDNITKLGIKNIYNFGTNNATNYKFLERKKLQEDKYKLFYNIEGEMIEFETSHIANHQAMNLTIGLAVAKLTSQNMALSAEALSQISPIFGRGKIIDAGLNGKNCKIICDHYNASPESMITSLQYFAEFDNPKKIAILADMLELGNDTQILHEKLVEYILRANTQSVFFVGANSKYIYGSMPDNIHKLHFDNIDELIHDIDSLVEGGEIILLKGSNSMRLNKLLNSFNGDFV